MIALKYNKINESNVFINILSMMRNTIFDFLLPLSKISNDSWEPRALLICCRTNGKIFGSLYRNHYYFCDNQINQGNANDVRTVRYSGSYETKSLFGRKKTNTRHLIKGVLPETTRTLIFEFEYNIQILPGALPCNLCELRMHGPYFNQPFIVGSLPNTIKILVLGDGFDQPLAPGSLPGSLTTLFLGSKFNQRLESGVLPSGLVDLEFSYSFDQPFDNGVLPESLTTLKLGYSFNQSCKNINLPDSLTRLRFGCSFNQPFEQGFFPESLVCLEFGSLFNQPIRPDSLPSKLIQLIFCRNSFFSRSLDTGNLPCNLQYLCVGIKYKKMLKSIVIPDSLRHLEIYENVLGKLQSIDLDRMIVISELVQIIKYINAIEL